MIWSLCVGQHDHVGTGWVRKIIFLLIQRASSLHAICLTLVWDRYDLAGLEHLAHAWGTRLLLYPYGMIGTTTCWRALLLV